jgi:class 3 adenylate cyclase
VDAMRELHPHRARAHDLRLTVRVGVHTSLVVVGPLGDGGPHDRWALGDAPRRGPPSSTSWRRLIPW